MSWLRQHAWSPYLVGALLGVLCWFAFASADTPLGVSTSFVRAVGLAEQAALPEHAAHNAYFEKTKLKIDWQFMLVIGMFLGAYVSGALSGDRQVESVPRLWQERFGSSVAFRAAAAFVGGATLMFGARLAGGCTSGHGISGALQLAASGWVFFAAVFVSGVVTTMALLGKVRGNV